MCRWCGYPVLADPAWREPLFHQRCYSWYGTVLLAYLFAGWLQLCAVVVGAALCLDNFRRVKMVLVPCIVSLSAPYSVSLALVLLLFQYFVCWECC